MDSQQRPYAANSQNAQQQQQSQQQQSAAPTLRGKLFQNTVAVHLPPFQMMYLTFLLTFFYLF